MPIDEKVTPVDCNPPLCSTCDEPDETAPVAQVDEKWRCISCLAASAEARFAGGVEVARPGLRDYFAGQALACLAGHYAPERVGEVCYVLADVMLTARVKGTS